MAYVIHASDCGREMVLYQPFFFAGPETGKNQDRSANSGVAQLDAFVGTGDPEPFRTGFLKSFGNWDSAEAVSVGFNDGENFSIGADLTPDYPQIMDDGFERNLRPNRPAFEMDGFRHRYLECQTPCRWRERNSGQPGRTLRLGKQSHVDKSSSRAFSRIMASRAASGIAREIQRLALAEL